MKRRLAFAIALWFGCGLSPVAPGTVGALGALPLYFLIRSRGGAFVLGVAALVAAVGVWAAGVVSDVQRIKDPQIVVVDEVAGTLIALAAAPLTVQGVVAAVVAFRVLDVVKPFPARQAETLPRGWGVMVDDLVAGAQAALLVTVLRGTGLLT